MATPLPRPERFALPEGLIYLDGNSLGPLPAGAEARAMRTVSEEWGGQLIRAWNTADWIGLPEHVGARIAGLIGAQAGSVTAGDTLSIKVHQALSSALAMRPDRRVILSDSGNFPADLYVAQGLVRALDRGHEIRTPAPEDVADAIGPDVAAVMLTHVDYRSGRVHDMAAITEAAHAAGAVMIWDLAHSAGAMALEIGRIGPEFAVGCTYKYLNGGPGAPAFIHVRPDIADDIAPMLAGWMGHAAPFAMEPGYRPAAQAARMRVGTPAVIQLSILDAALDVWDGVEMEALRAASITLSERFIAEVEARCPDVTLASPRDASRRGSQVSFAHPNAFEVMQALIARGVIGDVRPPDLMRFGFAPLYLSEADVAAAAAILADVIASGEWRRPEFAARGRVT